MILSSIEDSKGPMLDMSGSRRKALDNSQGKFSRSKRANEMDSSGALKAGEVFDINKGDYDKRTSLHLASSEGHYDIVDYLCKHGADVNVEDRWGGRPLDDAVQKGNKRVEAVSFSWSSSFIWRIADSV